MDKFFLFESLFRKEVLARYRKQVNRIKRFSSEQIKQINNKLIILLPFEKKINQDILLRVKVNDFTSNSFPIRAGVPQGS
ncbi:hypothetical protein BpHYR1_025528, partial [Brachionus plicatilis]